MNSRWIGIWITLAVVGVCSAQTLQDQFDAGDFNRRLGQAVNLGNALDAPQEGQWGLQIQAWHFSEIAAAGFDSVRVPIRWSAHAETEEPYSIDPALMERVEWVVQQATQQHLAVIINVHHYEELYADVDGQANRFKAIWRQIAERFESYPNTNVYFELLNEPRQKLTAERWKNLVQDILGIIRENNPQRMVLVGGVNYNSVDELVNLRLPADDRRLIGTFHFYDPFQFTHQGAEWVDGSTEWQGTKWEGNQTEMDAVGEAFDAARRWSTEQDRPVFLGEFGAYSKADMESRVRWTECVARTAEAQGFSWAYWEFGTGFGLMNQESRQWVEPLHKALAPTSLLDLDGETGLTIDDVDLLSSSIAAGSSDPRFDLDGSGTVDARDLRFWVHFTNHQLGDADLNGEVNFDDFRVLTENFDKAATWSQGDFDGSGKADFEDHAILAANFSDEHALAPSNASQETDRTPKPRTMVIGFLVLVAIWLWVMRRRAKPKVQP